MAARKADENAAGLLNAERRDISCMERSLLASKCRASASRKSAIQRWTLMPFVRFITRERCRALTPATADRLCSDRSPDKCS